MPRVVAEVRDWVRERGTAKWLAEAKEDSGWVRGKRTTVQQATGDVPLMTMSGTLVAFPCATREEVLVLVWLRRSEPW